MSKKTVSCFCQPRRFVQARGFTLTELLVVLAVLVVLSALIYPAISSASVKAKGAKSASNLRAIGAGIHGYLADNSGAFPFISGPNWTVPERWYEVIKPYLGQKAQQGGEIDVYRNPFIKFPTGGVSQYGASSFVMLYNSKNPDKPDEPPGWYWPHTPVRITDIAKPSQTLMVAATTTLPNVEPDRGIFNLNASGFVEGAYPTGWAMPLPNPDGRVPILYVDGHSDLMLWEELKERRREIIGIKPFNARW